MGKKIPKSIQKELPSIPTSYKVLIKGSVVNDQSDDDVGAVGGPGLVKPFPNHLRSIWRLCYFRNPARSDGLVLRHWRLLEKGSNSLSPVNSVKFEISQDLDCYETSCVPRAVEEATIIDGYPFARVNPSVKIYRYSDDFYRYHLADLDPTWTKEETDLLFDLCEMFELRFIAIHDRFKWRKDVPLEKMKQRYYSVTRRIVEFSFEEKMKSDIAKHGNTNHPVVLALEESQRHPLVKFTYNAEHDQERRRMLDRSWRITPEQRDMENNLLQEIKLAEIEWKNQEKKRGEMKRLKRKFHVIEDPIPSAKMDDFESKSVWLSSTFLSFYKPQLSAKQNEIIDDMLTALGISPPPITSRASIEAYCMVRGDAAIMINMMNRVDSLKRELEHWQEIAAHMPDALTPMKSFDGNFVDANSVNVPVDGGYNYYRPAMAKGNNVKSPIMVVMPSPLQPVPMPNSVYVGQPEDYADVNRGPDQQQQLIVHYQQGLPQHQQFPPQVVQQQQQQHIYRTRMFAGGAPKGEVQSDQRGRQQQALAHAKNVQKSNSVTANANAASVTGVSSSSASNVNGPYSSQVPAMVAQQQQMLAQQQRIMQQPYQNYVPQNGYRQGQYPTMAMRMGPNPNMPQQQQAVLYPQAPLGHQQHTMYPPFYMQQQQQHLPPLPSQPIQSPSSYQNMGVVKKQGGASRSSVNSV